MRKHIDKITTELLALLQHKVLTETLRKRPTKTKDILELTQALVYVEALVKARENEVRYEEMKKTLSGLGGHHDTTSTADALALLTAPKKKSDGGPGSVGKN